MSEPLPGDVLRTEILADVAASGMELDPKESLLLDKACHTANVIAQLEAAIEEHGPMVQGPKGTLIVNPAVVECRLQSLLLAQLLGRIDLGNGAPSAASVHGRLAANIRHHGRAAGRAAADG